MQETGGGCERIGQVYLWIAVHDNTYKMCNKYNINSSNTNVSHVNHTFNTVVRKNFFYSSSASSFFVSFSSFFLPPATLRSLSNADGFVPTAGFLRGLCLLFLQFLLRLDLLKQRSLLRFFFTVAFFLLC